MWRPRCWTVTYPAFCVLMLATVSAGFGDESAQICERYPARPFAAGRMRLARHATARLLAAGEQRARLEKPGGRVVSVSLESLHSDDQQFIRNQLAAAGAVQWTQMAVARTTGLVGLPALAAVPGLLDRASAPIPPNAIYVRISQPFLNRYIKHRVFKNAAVSDCILGTPVQGTSQTSGRTDLALVPDAKRGRIDLRLTGTADATTVGTHDPVSIFTHSTTDFHSAKQVLVDDRGITQSPAQTQAHTRSTTTAITTCLGPVLQRFVLPTAWRRVNESRAEADRISASHTARRVDRELDQAVDDATGRIRAAMVQLHNAMENQKIKQPRMLSSTTSEYLQVILLRDDADGQDVASFVAAPAADRSRPDIELTVHSAVVFAAMKDGELQASLKPVLNSPWYQSLLKFSAVALLSPGNGAPPGYEMHWSEGGEWLTLQWNAQPGARKDSVARASRK